MTPEEKKKLTAVLLLEKLKKKRVRVDGKRVSHQIAHPSAACELDVMWPRLLYWACLVPSGVVDSSCGAGM